MLTHSKHRHRPSLANLLNIGIKLSNHIDSTQQCIYLSKRPLELKSQLFKIKMSQQRIFSSKKTEDRVLNHHRSIMYIKAMSDLDERRRRIISNPQKQRVNGCINNFIESNMLCGVFQSTSHTFVFSRVLALLFGIVG